jgi:hypothetical protein
MSFKEELERQKARLEAAQSAFFKRGHTSKTEKVILISKPPLKFYGGGGIPKDLSNLTQGGLDVPVYSDPNMEFHEDEVSAGSTPIGYSDLKERFVYIRLPDGTIVRARQSSNGLILPIDDRAAQQPPVPNTEPPVNAEFILHLLLRKDEQDAIIGDLIERYGKKRTRLGVRRANWWFYAEIFWTALPLLKRAIVKASGLVAAGEWIRQQIQ